jgi:SRSO17 transposase
MFASKPHLAGALLERAHCLGIRAAFVAGDEVYGGRQLRRDIRQRGMGYVLAVRANHALTAGSHRPGETGPTGCTGRPGAAATSTAPAKRTDAGTPTRRQHRDQ